VSAHCSPLAPTHSYFVVMIRYDRHCEAVVDPEITRREVIERIQTREYAPERIAFIHFINEDGFEDLTRELIEAAHVFEMPLSPSERLAALHDHNRKLRAETR
jgi:hypothetical protein